MNVGTDPPLHSKGGACADCRTHAHARQVHRGADPFDPFFIHFFAHSLFMVVFST
jgi:hypothetical protein